MFFDASKYSDKLRQGSRHDYNMSNEKDIAPPNTLRNEKSNEVQQLREENARLKALLTSHGIAWEEPPAAGHTGAGYADFLEGNATAVRWAPAPGTCRQTGCTYLRLRRKRPVTTCPDVEQASARLPSHGLSDQAAGCTYLRNWYELKK